MTRASHVVPGVANGEGTRTLAMLCTAGALAYCSYAVCRVPLLPLFARQLGADVRTVGFVVGASTMTGVLLKLPAGAWSDILGRRLLLLSGAFVFAVLPFMYLSVASIGVLIALRMLHGSATAIFGPVAAATVSDVAPAHGRATWLSTYATAQGVGQAFGPVVAGYLLAAGRFDLAFTAAGLVAIATPLIIGRLPVRRTPAPAGAAFDRFRAGIAEVVREPLIVATSGAQAAQFMLHGTLSAFLPLFAHEVLGIAPAQLGWLFGLQMASTLAARPLVGMAADRAGRRGLIAAGLATCSAAVYMIPMAGSVQALVPAIVLYAVGVAVTTAASSAFITDLARKGRYGAAHGVFGTIYDVGDALGPVGAGLLVARVGYAHTFQAMSGLTAIVAAVFYIAARRLQRRDAKTAPQHPTGGAG